MSIKMVGSYQKLSTSFFKFIFGIRLKKFLLICSPNLAERISSKVHSFLFQHGCMKQRVQHISYMQLPTMANAYLHSCKLYNATTTGKLAKLQTWTVTLTSILHLQETLASFSSGTHGENFRQTCVPHELAILQPYSVFSFPELTLYGSRRNLGHENTPCLFPGSFQLFS